MKKITKKQIAIEYDCMMSVKGPYPEGNEMIKSAIGKAQEPYHETCKFQDGTVKRMLNHGAQSRKEIIDRAYDLLNDEA